VLTAAVTGRIVAVRLSPVAACRSAGGRELTLVEEVREMARMASRPRSVTVWFRGIPYLLDLVKCRRALVERQVEGELDSMESLANSVAISRSTASRFFSGRPTSLTVMLKILEALHLTFENVTTPVVEDGEDTGREPPSAGVRVAPAPRRPGPGTGLRLGA
jgi:hypothetical protein